MESLTELFRTDDRPTFIIDALPPRRVRYMNPAYADGFDDPSKALSLAEDDAASVGARWRGIPLAGGLVAIHQACNGAFRRLAGRAGVDLEGGRRIGEAVVTEHSGLLQKQFARLRTGPACGPVETAAGAVCVGLVELPARLAEQAERADMVMHELKNTIGCVLHAADTIQTAVLKLADTRATHVQQRRITADALTLSLLGARVLELRLGEAQPDALLAQLARLFAPETQAADVELRTRVHGDAPDRLLLDSGRLLQILVNLTANAVKATPRGGQVTVALQFSVEDTGCGMAPDAVERLFHRFAQPGNGIGLGLHIARRLVELHHGRICVSSVPGHGSSFDFYVRALRPPAARPPATRWLPPAGLLHCLIVDDNHIVRRVLGQQLRELGVRVSLAEDGRKALAMLRKMDVSVVLLDLDMPVMDGLMCVKNIRQMERCSKLPGRVPVVGVTGTSDPREALEAGMDSVVNKPFRMAEVWPHVMAVAAKVQMGIGRLCE
ncbi:Histidine kinase-group xi protein [Lasiodiplodia theobromae]|uniref:Histidine kinase-group xi protein n=1 Tax=Lasiodiplodia theobromae TaxID=45133 RepID=UPI0015C3BB93|nr:Histidine kinase-group xi protein [Lasiodiplodia theobromae]KAF4546837.1 Histidine kinase-group xi protein [Lasiodiplodia theobromae]